MLLSLGDLSTEPNPSVEILPLKDTFAKSAKFASRLATAAQPPLLFISESLSSLNQTSPDKFFPISVEGFLSPKVIVFIFPKDGFPLIENLYFFSPGSLLIKLNSLIILRSSSKYTASFDWILSDINFSLIFKNFSKSKSIELLSGCQTFSELNLVDCPLLYDVGFKGTSIW